VFESLRTFGAGASNCWMTIGFVALPVESGVAHGGRYLRLCGLGLEIWEEQPAD